jgi:hypothetical protein
MVGQSISDIGIGVTVGAGTILALGPSELKYLLLRPTERP